MSLTIALAGNPNCGKTTLFNALTGSNQFVGNWPGVTVEKKEGRLKKHNDVIIADLPGIYSLSPYTLEEVVARNYLINQRPDAILNIIDGTNLERNLYLTTQLTELGIPVVIAINMMDVVRKNGDTINTNQLAKELGCQVVEISALKGDGVELAAQAAVAAAKGTKTIPMHAFSGPVEHAIAHIEEVAVHNLPEEQQRWYAIKLFERDSKAIEALKLDPSVLEHIEQDIVAAETELDDDSESIITNDRYLYIASIIKSCYKKANAGQLSTSDKIDKVVTNRWLGLPIFVVIMFLVYYISMVTVGSAATGWANDGVFGDGWHLLGIGSSEFADAEEQYGDTDLIIDAFAGEYGNDDITAALDMESEDYTEEGAKAALDALVAATPADANISYDVEDEETLAVETVDNVKKADLEDAVAQYENTEYKEAYGAPDTSTYGVWVPGIMASRTIENERDRRMTIMTTTFIPCGAKMPFIAMIAGAIFGGSAWVSTSAYFLGMACIIVSGIILKKTKMFSGDPAPFVMELPAYHWPTVGNVLRSMWERGWSFIKKAGTIILLSTILVWFTTYFGFVDGAFQMLEEDQIDHSILATIGSAIAWIFAPLGWGNWQSAVASITGLVAKENIVGTMGILFSGGDGNVYNNIAATFTAVSGYSFLAFNLLCAPCFAAMGAIKREMNNAKWTWFAIGYQCGFAYVIALIINQIGCAFTGNLHIVGLIVAIFFVAAIIYLLVRPYKEADSLKTPSAVGSR